MWFFKYGVRLYMTFMNKTFNFSLSWFLNTMSSNGRSTSARSSWAGTLYWEAALPARKSKYIFTFHRPRTSKAIHCTLVFKMTIIRSPNTSTYYSCRHLCQKEWYLRALRCLPKDCYHEQLNFYAATSSAPNKRLLFEYTIRRAAN